MSRLLVTGGAGSIGSNFVRHVIDYADHQVTVLDRLTYARYAIDSSRLRAELGWRPKYDDFETGMFKTIDWYRAHEDWWSPVKDATESFYARVEESAEQKP